MPDTDEREPSEVQYAAALGEELGSCAPAGRASWPVAIARTVATADEALACRRAVLRRRDESGEPVRRASWLRDSSSRIGRRMRLAVEVEGPVPSEPCLLVSNHVSYLDPIAIGQVLPLSAVAKSEITGWPAIGEVLDALGIVFVERGNARSGAVALRRAMRVLGAGVPVLVFPEGTTTSGDDVLPFSRGAFGMARLMRVPVIPATLRYESSEACWVGSASLLPHLLRMHRHHEVGVRLTFGPRLEPMAFSDAASLASATRQCIRSLVLR